MREDLVLHFLVSFNLVTYLSLITTLPGAVFITLLVGILKETWDYFKGRDDIKEDMYANLLGILSASSLIIIVDLIATL